MLLKSLNSLLLPSMLNRIVVINSTLYAKANRYLGDAESIRLAAENNVGKRSLINCLKFTNAVNLFFEYAIELADNRMTEQENNI